MFLTIRFLVSIINFVFGIVAALIGLRIILRLFGASPAAPFVDWVFDTSQPLIAPFQGMFPSPVIEGQFVIEFSSLFALVIYAFVGYLLTDLAYILAGRAEERERRRRK